MKKNKIIFLESILKEGGGHHMDNLIESSLYFNDKKKIYWALNENFKEGNLFIPKNIQINKIINDIDINFIPKYFIFFKNFIFALFFFYKKKKFFLFTKIFIKNYFSFPIFLNLKTINFFINENLNESDVIIIQSCRPKDVELIFFLTYFFEKKPKLIFRILYPPKKNKFKNFYFHVSEMIKNKVNIKLFSEVSTIKNYVSERSSFKINNFTQIYQFYNRKYTNKFTLGFIGETRNDKGFKKLPDFINNLFAKLSNVDFIIQFSKKKYPDTFETKKKLIEMAKIDTRITILDGYLDFWEYRRLLQKINIMPILYDPNKLNFVGSGLFYSSITHEIPLIIPSKSILLKEYLVFKNYIEATTLEDYILGVEKIVNNYEYYLNQSKKLAKLYKENLDKDALVKEVI